MNIVGAAILFVISLIILLSSRRLALLAMMAGILYLTQGQKIEIFGINFFALRFVEVAGFARVIMRGELKFVKITSICKALLLLYAYTTVIFLLRSSSGHAYQIGLAVDALLSYFIFRSLIRNIDDLQWFLHNLVLILVPYLFLVSIERFTGHNPFAFMGDIIEGVYTRGGVPRCMGSFRHPVLLGTLGACLIPLYIGTAFDNQKRPQAIVGIVTCSLIVFLSNSGGPIGSAMTGIVGWLLWTYRSKMKMIRRGVIVSLIFLALIMKAPIWYLPAKFSAIAGGDGWHRSYLIDTAIKNIDKWWFSGIPIEDTKDWFPYALSTTGGADITNQYILFGLSAGIISTILFITLLTKAYKNIGMSLDAIRSDKVDIRKREPVMWGLGVMLSVHLITWLGISYFDQSYVLWFMYLAIITNLTQESIDREFALAPQ